MSARTWSPKDFKGYFIAGGIVAAFAGAVIAGTAWQNSTEEPPTPAEIVEQTNAQLAEDLEELQDELREAAEPERISDEEHDDNNVVVVDYTDYTDNEGGDTIMFRVYHNVPMPSLGEGVLCDVVENRWGDDGVDSVVCPVPNQGR